MVNPDEHGRSVCIPIYFADSHLERTHPHMLSQAPCIIQTFVYHVRNSKTTVNSKVNKILGVFGGYSDATGRRTDNSH